MEKVAIYYSRPFETGGIEKTMLERGKYLSKKGYDITFVFNNKSSQLNTLEKWAEIGRVVRYDYLNEKFDYAIYDAIYDVPYINAKKQIQVINGCMIEGKEKYCVPFRMDEYIAVSEEAKKQFERITRKKCKVIPNIINDKEIKELAKEEYDLPKAKYNFVTVSRIDQQKGFERIDKILNQLEKENIDYQWVFVGSNNLYPYYMATIKERFKRYKVKFVGMQDNPYKYMANADVLFQLSDYESQCMVMYEALSLGIPCVCTDFPNAVEELTGDRGIVLDKDLTRLDLSKILKLKKGFEYKYPRYEEKWLEILKMPEHKDVKFSIIIPNYNNEQWLEKCLTSIINQTYKNYEVIFVDDMSTDNSVRVADKILNTDKTQHRIILNKQKRLNGGSRNVGILEATGDYILCLDSDDWLKHDKVLETINNEIIDQDVIFTGFDLYNGKKEGLFPFVPKYENLYQAFINDVCAIWTKVVKTEILKETLFPEGTLAEDRVHHYRVIEKCDKFSCIRESTHVWNRANSHSVTTARNVEWEASTFKHMGEMYKFIKTTKDDKYRQYVIMKYNRQKKEIEQGRYEQL